MERKNPEGFAELREELDIEVMSALLETEWLVNGQPLQPPDAADGIMPRFEQERLLVLPRSGKQLVIISRPKSAKPFTLPAGKELCQRV